MKKDGRIDFRVPLATKTLWEGYAEELGYPNATVFYGDAIEHYYAVEKAKAAEGGSQGETPRAADPPAVGPNVSGGGAPLSGPLTQFQSPIVPTRAIGRAGGCENTAKHRKGAYCKSCKKVI